jgi:hypothetical protein
VAFGELRQGDLCVDTMGHLSGGSVRTNKCHGSGGNQVGNQGDFLPSSLRYKSVGKILKPTLVVRAISV